MTEPYITAIPDLPDRTDATPATPDDHAQHHTDNQRATKSLSQEMLDARGVAVSVPARLTTMTTATTTAQTTATTAVAAAAAAQTTANAAAVDTTVLKKANNLSDVASIDTSLANLGITNLYEGVEAWLFAHSMGSTGASSQFGCFGDRVGRRLGTIGRIATNTMQIETGPMYGRVHDNNDHHVQFSTADTPAGNVPFDTEVTTFPLTYTPRNNAVFFGSAAVNKWPGINNNSWPTRPIGYIENRMFNGGYTPGLPGVLMMMVARNNWYYYGSDADSLTEFKHSLRSMLRFARVGTITHPSAGTTGSWTTFAGQGYGGGHLSSNTNLSTLTMNFTGDELLVSLLHFDDGVAAGDAAINNLSDTVIYVPQYTTSGGFTASVGGGDNFHHRTHRITGFGSGSHAVKLIQLGSANYIGIDWYGTPASEPPLCVVVKEGNDGDPNYATYMTAIDTVVAEAEFTSYTMTVDGNANSWNNSTMTVDAVHPNDRGHEHLATNIVRSLAVNTTWRDGAHVL